MLRMSPIECPFLGVGFLEYFSQMLYVVEVSCAIHSSAKRMIGNLVCLVKVGLMADTHELLIEGIVLRFWR